MYLWFSPNVSTFLCSMVACVVIVLLLSINGDWGVIRYNTWHGNKIAGSAFCTFKLIHPASYLCVFVVHGGYWPFHCGQGSSRAICAMEARFAKTNGHHCDGGRPYLSSPMQTHSWCDVDSISILLARGGGRTWSSSDLMVVCASA